MRRQPTNDKGNTDLLLKMLAQHKVNGLFFVLGERLQARSQAQGSVALPELYIGQCVALHGWKHQSHQKWDQWQASILDTQRLVKEVLPQNYRPYFRPPYGQRRSDSEDFFHENGLTVSFWNIDSQDWSAKASSDEVKQRMLTLMLLWRHGVILFRLSRRPERHFYEENSMGTTRTVVAGQTTKLAAGSSIGSGLMLDMVAGARCGLFRRCRSRCG